MYHLILELAIMSSMRLDAIHHQVWDRMYRGFVVELRGGNL
jgi:hypothetical protein